ncbi:MAG: N-acetyltransferase [Sedimentisphaerales bacterium]|nr:N-acetyltransferase [Sedimentisphaerales bacterium]
MKIRDATISDAKAIHALVTYYAEFDRMLFRSMADIYENLQTFKVVEEQGRVVGCCALQAIWSDLAELKSLAIDKDFSGRGLGRSLVQAAIETAKLMGVPKIFALTLEPDFFKKLGFEQIDNDLLPMKVWRDCAKCSKQENCDEIALILDLSK